MTGPRDFSAFEQFKWLVLDHAANMEVGMAYGFARDVFPEAPEEEIEEIVCRAMLELYDEGLIGLFHSSRDQGYNLKIDQVDQLDRAEIVRELIRSDLSTFVEPDDQILFYSETKKGEDVFRSLPPGAVWRRS